MAARLDKGNPAGESRRDEKGLGRGMTDVTTTVAGTFNASLWIGLAFSIPVGIAINLITPWIARKWQDRPYQQHKKRIRNLSKRIKRAQRYLKRYGSVNTFLAVSAAGAAPPVIAASVLVFMSILPKPEPRIFPQLALAPMVDHITREVSATVGLSVLVVASMLIRGAGAIARDIVDLPDLEKYLHSLASADPATDADDPEDGGHESDPE